MKALFQKPIEIRRFFVGYCQIEFIFSQAPSGSFLILEGVKEKVFRK